MRIELIPKVDKLWISYRRFTLCLHCCWVDMPNRGLWHMRRQKSDVSALEARNTARQNKSMFFGVVTDELGNFWDQILPQKCMCFLATYLCCHEHVMWAHITCNVRRDWRSVPCQLHAKTNKWFCKFVARWKRSYRRSASAFCLQLLFGANGIANEKEQSNLILLYSVAGNLYGTQELHCRRLLNCSDVPLAQTGSHILPSESFW